MSFFSRMAGGGRSSNPQNNVGGVPEYEFGALYKSLDDLEFLETLGTGTFGRVRLVQQRLGHLGGFEIPPLLNLCLVG